MQTLWKAGWAPLLVLCIFVAAAKIFDAFTRFPALDVPAHFFGGLAVTYFFWRACANAQSVAVHLTNSNQTAFVFACTATTTILWEVFELLSDRWLGTRMEHGLADTSSDIFFGLAGGVAYLVLRRTLAAVPRAGVAAPGRQMRGSDPPR